MLKINDVINTIKNLNNDPGYINEDYLRGQVELLCYLMGFQGCPDSTLNYIYDQLDVNPI